MVTDSVPGSHLARTLFLAGGAAAVALLFLVATCQEIGRGDRLPREFQAQLDVRRLVDEFHVARLTRSRPTSLDALLASRPKDPRWPDPPRLDPWGEPYVLRLLPGGAEPDDEIVSSGPDRVLGTEDDVRARIWGRESPR